ncbi:MAG TPA: cytochrome c peroxidase [Polyangia bacterium]|nr:cytochrome c peroxidase [Polyangia bacterium]
MPFGWPSRSVAVAAGAVLVAALAIGVEVAWNRQPQVAPPATSDRELRISVGRRIFFDKSLSEPPGTSCASCHDPAHAFAGNNGSTNGVAQGSRPGHFARRNTPSVLYLKFIKRFHYHWEEDAPLPDAFGGFFWDGRVDSLAALVRQPLTNPDEMNAREDQVLAAKVGAAPYAGDLRHLFGTLTTSTLVSALGQSIEAFLLSDEMSPFSSRYDDYIRRRATLTPIELRGMALFRDPEKGNCAFCHKLNPTAATPSRSLFSDFGYEALAVPRNHRIPANARADYNDLGLCERNDPKSHTNDPRLCASFRTPSLRNVAARHYLMHNGQFSSLRDAVAFYATRSTDPARWYGPNAKFDDVPTPYRQFINERIPPYDRHEGQQPRLNDDDIDAIVAFLRTLTDAPFRDGAEGNVRQSEVSFRRSESGPAH